MLNEWLETAKYDVDESMADDWTYDTERGPFYIEADIAGHHITAHHWNGASWWGILIEPLA